MSNSLEIVWRQLLAAALEFGSEVSPRGLLTKELAGARLLVDMNYPILGAPVRKIGYRSMAAEAAWIVGGSNKLAGIAPYMPRMKEFSDDGDVLYGAYGPRFIGQLEHVVTSLLRDENTRQATMTTWRPNPMRSKDTPCTVALDFKIRGGSLHTHVFMRSSDQWLGVPYDVFSFTMMSCVVLSNVNSARLLNQDCPPLELGTLFLTAASSHLYESNFEGAAQVLDSPLEDVVKLPTVLYDGSLTWPALVSKLQAYRDGPQPFWRHHPDFVGASDE